MAVAAGSGKRKSGQRIFRRGGLRSTSASDSSPGLSSCQEERWKAQYLVTMLSSFASPLEKGERMKVRGYAISTT
jgi:hypothetical protein